MFSGVLADTDLGEVLRLLTLSNQTGSLQIAEPISDIPVGSIYVQLGQLVHAETGELTGLDAAFQLSAYTGHRFSFEPNITTSSKTLTSYSTPELVEKIKARSLAIAQFISTLPAYDDIPHYIPGKKIDGFQATPDELRILLACQGKESVLQIAKHSQYEINAVREVLAKFQAAGMIWIEPSPSAKTQTATPEAPPLPEEPASRSDSEKPARYWRGKRIS